MGLLFGTAGIPIQSKRRGSDSGIEMIQQLGLDCMELEFVRGVHMGIAKAEQVRAASKTCNIALSVHAPYYLNLNSSDNDKVDASLKRIQDSAAVGAIAGAKGVVFHPGFYQGSNPEGAYNRIKENLNTLTDRLRQSGIEIMLRPETTGKPSQFGSLEELIRMSSEIENCLPCVDFAHLHARNGKNNSTDEFRNILLRIEKSLGSTALDNMHIHLSGIEYSGKGERRHLNLEESDFNYLDMLGVLKDFNTAGLLICESPNLESDALLLKRTYEKM